ncbi:MAG: YceD family protein [Bacillota bacterium]|jgi:uncharacterized protein|nr:DUF177 domain-containing protein [Bacillota bacterium]NLU55204.1 DUF177 domain-containing protein [Bacillota bacterium]HOA91964.1 DUF177 domain-containing protein [Bacillota bacterium]HOJ45775.1 DUF177 domain-containing protein [Bacillota bacterium]HOL13613.1 DUF177 domain-containing protein [Bacillota bacterium]
MRDLIRDLRISVANLDSGDDRSFEFFLPQDAWQIPDDQVEPRAPLEIEGNIVHAGDFFVLKVNVKTRLKMECTRCLSDFEQDFVLDIEEELKKADSYDTLSDELEDEEESYSTFSGQEINLGEIIVDHMVLGLPFQRLCDENCKGLCPHCGQDLNKGRCDCEEEKIDPRLQALKNLLNE